MRAVGPAPLAPWLLALATACGGATSGRRVRSVSPEPPPPPQPVDAIQLVPARPASMTLPDDATGETASSEPATDDAVTSASQPATAPTAIVASVNGVPITVAEVEAHLRAQSDKVRRYYRSPEHRREFIDKLVNLELLAQEARRRGLDRDPDVQLAYDAALAERLLSQPDPNRPVTDDEARAYYQAHIDDYVRPERVRVSQILLVPGKQGTLADLRAEAKQIVAEAAGGDASLFRELVERYSDDAVSRAKGGDLGEIGRDDAGKKRDDHEALPAELINAAFAIPDIGETTVVETDRGIHVLLLTARYSATQRSYQEVRAQILDRLQRDHQQDTIQALEARLRGHAQVKIVDRAIRTLVDP